MDAIQIRKIILEQSKRAHVGHIGSCLSIVEIIVALYSGVMKAAATMYCGYIANQENVYIPTLRLYSVFGQWEEPKRLIPALITYGLEGKYPPLVNPDTARDFIYVDDVCQAFSMVTEQKKSDRAPINWFCDNPGVVARYRGELLKDD